MDNRVLASECRGTDDNEALTNHRFWGFVILSLSRALGLGLKLNRLSVFVLYKGCRALGIALGVA